MSGQQQTAWFHYTGTRLGTPQPLSTLQQTGFDGQALPPCKCVVMGGTSEVGRYSNSSEIPYLHTKQGFAPPRIKL